MNAKDRIERDMKDYYVHEDVNHPVRRFFRCWLDGSYNGEGHYKANCEFAKENQDKPEKLKMHVIREFCEYTASDYDCSYGHAQKCIVACSTKEQLERLNKELVEDLLDLIQDLEPSPF